MFCWTSLLCVSVGRPTESLTDANNLAPVLEFLHRAKCLILSCQPSFPQSRNIPHAFTTAVSPFYWSVVLILCAQRIYFFHIDAAKRRLGFAAADWRYESNVVCPQGVDGTPGQSWLASAAYSWQQQSCEAFPSWLRVSTAVWGSYRHGLSKRHPSFLGSFGPLVLGSSPVVA